MNNSQHWIEEFIFTAASMPTEKIAVVGMVLIVLTALLRDS